MTTTYLRGPDAQRLLSSLAVNSFETFGVGRSRHFVCSSPDGYLIGDGILYTVAPEEMVLVGRAAGHNWGRFCAETGGWDVSVEADEIFSLNPAGRRTVYRYQVEGPHALELVAQLIGAPLPEAPWSHIFPVSIAGHGRDESDGVVRLDHLPPRASVSNSGPAARLATDLGRGSGWASRVDGDARGGPSSGPLHALDRTSATVSTLGRRVASCSVGLFTTSCRSPRARGSAVDGQRWASRSRSVTGEPASAVSTSKSLTRLGRETNHRGRRMAQRGQRSSCRSCE